MNDYILVAGQLVQRGSALLNLVLSAGTLLLIIGGYKK